MKHKQSSTASFAVRSNGYTHQSQPQHPNSVPLSPYSNIQTDPSLRRNTHPQLPLPLLSLQHQSLNRITQPLLLPPQLLEPQRLSTPLPTHPHTTSHPRAPTRSSLPNPPLEELSARYESLFTPGKFVEMVFYPGEEGSEFWG